MDFETSAGLASAIWAYMTENELSERAFAAHAGVPIATLRSTTRHAQTPRPETAAKLTRALGAKPAARPRRQRIGKYDDTVRNLWGRAPMADIIEACGAKRRQDIEQVARRLGLPIPPPKISQAAE